MKEERRTTAGRALSKVYIDVCSLWLLRPSDGGDAVVLPDFSKRGQATCSTHAEWSILEHTPTHGQVEVQL